MRPAPAAFLMLVIPFKSELSKLKTLLFLPGHFPKFALAIKLIITFVVSFLEVLFGSVIGVVNEKISPSEAQNPSNIEVFFVIEIVASLL